MDTFTISNLEQLFEIFNESNENFFGDEDNQLPASEYPDIIGIYNIEKYQFLR